MKKYIFILAIGIGIFFLPHLSLADTLTQGVQTQSGTITEWKVDYGDFRGYGTCAGITINGATVSSDCASYYGTFDATGTWSFNVGDKDV